VKFRVIDMKTGKPADMRQIAVREKWAHDLIYCDMQDFMLGPDGSLYLGDECGNFVECPPDLFTVEFTEMPPYPTPGGSGVADLYQDEKEKP